MAGLNNFFAAFPPSLVTLKVSLRAPFILRSLCVTAKAWVIQCVCMHERDSEFLVSKVLFLQGY